MLSFEALVARAADHLSSIVSQAIRLGSSERILVVYDLGCELSRIMAAAYRKALPQADFLDFDAHAPADILSAMLTRPAGDLVILVQSTNFRLNEFRVRIQLFEKHLKTIEHMHLNRMKEDQYETYINTLAFDPDYYMRHGHGLKTKLDAARRVIVQCAGTELVYDGPMEAAKMNIGDYRGMENVGGTFPIGEVFTEAQDLRAIHGSIKIFAFAGMDHCMQWHQPFLATVQHGLLEAGPDAPQEFLALLDMVRVQEPVMVREFGLGLNPAIDREHVLSDLTAYERMYGLHLSLGAKHSVYKKPDLDRKTTRYHVDIFVDVERILADDVPIFQNGKYVI